MPTLIHCHKCRREKQIFVEKEKNYDINTRYKYLASSKCLFIYQVSPDGFRWTILCWRKKGGGGKKKGLIVNTSTFTLGCATRVAELIINRLTSMINLSLMIPHVRRCWMPGLHVPIAVSTVTEIIDPRLLWRRSLLARQSGHGSHHFLPHPHSRSNWSLHRRPALLRRRFNPIFERSSAPWKTIRLITLENRIRRRKSFIYNRHNFEKYSNINLNLIFCSLKLIIIRLWMFRHFIENLQNDMCKIIRKCSKYNS